MAQEEQTHVPRFTSSSGGGSGGAGAGGGGSGGVGGGSHRSSKKLKHKKVPQRGMGVAQLEKIISEEQHNINVSIVSPANSSVPNFRPPMIPLPPPLPPNHHPLIPKTDAVNHVSVSNPNNTTSSGGNNWTRYWTGGEYNQQPENLSGLPYESNPPIWPPLPNITQRSQMFQKPCSSSMVNVSLGTSSSNFQMEPPSNQSYCGNSHPPLWPEEEKMVGMKRPYPFSMENMPIPSFHCKFPSAFVSRSDELASCSNGGAITSLEPPNPVFRENPSSLSTITDQMTKKLIDDNGGGLTRDFLTLAPPRASSSSSHSSSKEKLPQFEALPLYQSQTRDCSLHSFFPAAKTPGNSNGDAGENVDLNLKL